MSQPQSEPVVACLVDKDGEFLLVQETKSASKGRYNLPSGRVKADELLADAAVRETKEETGLDVELTGVVGFYQSIYEDSNMSGPVYLAVVVGGQITPNDKHPDIVWVSNEDIEQMERDDKLRFKYISLALQDFERRGIYPLDVISSVDYRT